MIQFLTKVGTAHFLQVIRMATYFLNATVWRWMHGLSTIRVVSGLLDAYMTPKSITFVLFRWLIFMYTLCDPRDIQLYNSVTLNNAIKVVCIG
jgi:hypothetical protein